MFDRLWLLLFPGFLLEWLAAALMWRPIFVLGLPVVRRRLHLPTPPATLVKTSVGVFRVVSTSEVIARTHFRFIDSWTLPTGRCHVIWSDDGAVVTGHLTLMHTLIVLLLAGVAAFGFVGALRDLPDMASAAVFIAVLVAFWLFLEWLQLRAIRGWVDRVIAQLEGSVAAESA